MFKNIDRDEKESSGFWNLAVGPNSYRLPRYSEGVEVTNQDVIDHIG